MSIEWSAIAAVGGLLAGTTAVAALALNWHRSRIARQTELLLKHYENFYNPYLRQVRRVAAQNILDGKTTNYELEDVLDHFEVIGALLERKALEYGVVHALFDWWILRWWQCAESYVERRRNDPRDPDVQIWFNLEILVRRIIADRERLGLPDLPESALERFLEEESRTLDPHGLAGTQSEPTPSQ